MTNTTVTVYCIDENTPAAEGFAAEALLTSPSISKSPPSTIRRILGTQSLGRTPLDIVEGTELTLESCRSFRTGRTMEQDPEEFDVVVAADQVILQRQQPGQPWVYAVTSVRPASAGESEYWSSIVLDGVTYWGSDEDIAALARPAVAALLPRCRVGFCRQRGWTALKPGTFARGERLGSSLGEAMARAAELGPDFCPA